MRYFEIISESRKPKFTQKLIHQRKDAERRYEREQLEKIPLFAHMYAIDKPHDLFMQAVERYKADIEVKQLQRDEEGFVRVKQMAAKERKRQLGV